MIRIQFHRQACPLPALLANFGTDEQCADALGASRWPQGFSCPGCGNTNYYLFKAGKHKNFQYKCFRLQASLTAGTLFQRTRLSLSDCPGNLSDQPNQDRPDGKAGWDSGNKVSFVAAISLGVESRLLYIKWHWHLVLRAKRFLTELPLTSRQVVKWNKTQFE
ncbi:MAG TPA: transposase [Nitrosomonas mobilis]|nr:transposase [Nitrosomonas mobilis]